ncbi:MAG TPA: hypothetical protein VJC16_04710 [Candidatus Nanoarchaeia archaeon]|nr:hypothetical protein [Candidatus Nanoarchaeia archaeon]
METPPIDQAYGALQKRHALPPFKEMDAEFELSYIDNSHFLLREIRRRIMEKLDAYLKLLEDLLQAEPNVSTMHEQRLFSDGEKAEAFSLFSKLMRISRESAILDLDNGDAETSAFISATFSEWKLLKPALAAIIRKMQESWVAPEDAEERLGYFG